MFDVGFTELLLVALVALLVLGPERLPGAARTAGLWVGRLKRSFNAIKSEVEREIGADEIRRQLHNENILAQERQQLARQTPSTRASDTPASGEAAAAQPSAEAAGTPELPRSRQAALEALQAQAEPDATAPAPAPAPTSHSEGSSATPSEPPRPT